MILVVQSESAWDSVALLIGATEADAAEVAHDNTSLVLEHLPMVRAIVERIRSRVPMHVNADDLYSAGVEGLLAAARKYDSSRGKFAFYASTRIRGMILDELRGMDSAPRRARFRIRQMAAARDELLQALGRQPTDAELAAKLGLGSREYRRWARDAEPVTMVPLDAGLPGEDGDGAQIHELLADTEAVDVRQSMEHSEELAIALRYVDGLPPHQRQVIRECYFDGRKLADIADRMGFTESRVCQIRQEALTALRHSVGRESNHVALPVRRREPRARKATDDAEADLELVRRTLAGDNRAFEELMGRHKDKLYSVAINLIKRPQDAEEIVQDTFVRALRALPRFRGDSSVSTWLTRITMNLSKNRWWYNRRRKGDASISMDCALSEESDETFSSLICDASPGPARELANTEFAAIVARCMGELPAHQKHILSLRGTLHRSYDEIAAELRVNVGTVKSRLARARDSLKSLILAACPDLSGIDAWVEPDRDAGAITKA